MENAKQTFRSSMGGYNKQDVNDYIASLSESFAREKADYEKKLDDITELVESLKSQNAAAETDTERVSEAEKELERANALIAEQTQALDSKESELEALREKLVQCEKTNADLKAQLEKYADCEEKLKSYDLMSQKMGELMLKAASSAEQIRADAETEAEKTIRSSLERSKELQLREEEMARSLEKRYSDAVAAINRKLSELISEGYASLGDSMKAADEEIASLLEQRRSEARAAVLRAAERLPELEALAVIGNDK